MLKIGLAALLALTLGACQTTATKPRRLAEGEFDTPIKAGETRLRLQNFDREKWQSRGLDTLSAARTAFVCRPLACPAPSWVVYARLNSPTRKPDPQALLDLAQRVADKAAQEGATITAQPRTGTTKGFPSFSFAYTKQRDGKTEFGSSTSVFAGSLAFNILSVSQNEAATGRHLDEFLRAVEIVDGGPRRNASRR
ncbi:exported hypothetical protein [Bosea sp. 62]|uniref:hypothetical protein n=1 Tax=unclassified Bosea (in: a-proteobacteria) TaxID=2653178 RepID=UPI00125C6DC2|nr:MULTISPECIES: hypothetical protein [unclassified Bosea (in: a-proteobacteria)]CAD5249729.1 exported hypothetical protein [Bosea sp. 7B]CAD5282762.1 exported hypothetical protein [Bosea sp. 21B]CAD5285398.1 exported hypothetical protein [Bosea sp. 46]VVT62281.1 exported hypothetical protein [Bosea sp. EC-HK365B]VXB20692.1 exported hypothetical protein [Bosea sp. 62]